jgi:excisionase family DNA binding protein
LIKNAIAHDDRKPVFDSVDDLAAYLGMSRHNTYRELRAGNIPAIRLGKRFIIPRSAIERWLDSAGGNVAA